MNKKEIFESLECPLKVIVDGDENPKNKLLLVCNLLKESLEGYNWVGFYFTDLKNPKELVLGPFAGDDTDHKRIPFGRGICGRVAETKETLIIDDVCKETNYLSCSAFVKSEIVVPIMSGNEFLGEIDIDSHEISNFDEFDLEFLEWISGTIIDVVKSYMGNLKNE